VVEYQITGLSYNTTHHLSSVQFTSNNPHKTRWKELKLLSDYISKGHLTVWSWY